MSKKITYYGQEFDIPDESTEGFIATDKNGQVFTYLDEPVKLHRTWGDSYPCKIIGSLNTTILENIDWKCTLKKISDLILEQQSPETITTEQQAMKTMAHLKAGTEIRVGENVYYLTQDMEAEISTKRPKTAKEIARDWWNRIAPKSDYRYRYEIEGEIGDDDTPIQAAHAAAEKCANSWETSEIAERARMETIALNLLRAAALHGNKKQQRGDRVYIISDEKDNTPYVQAIDTDHYNFNQIGTVIFNREKDAEEALKNLSALNLLQYLLIQT